MSIEGRIGDSDNAAIEEALDVKWLFRHRFSPSDFIRHFRRMASLAAAEGLPGLRQLAPDLLSLISDEKTIHHALRHLETSGSHAPGPDGLRYEDIAQIGDWP